MSGFYVIDSIGWLGGVLPVPHDVLPSVANKQILI